MQTAERLVDAAVVERLRQAAQDLEGETVALTQELVRIPTENPKLTKMPAGAEAECQDVIEARFRALGCTTERWDVYPGRPDVVGTLQGERGEGARSLILNGHIDVVPGGDPAAWTYPPFAAEIADGKIWGRGAVDMKGPIAAMIVAIEAIQRAGIRLLGDVILESVVDEEAGGPGTSQTVEHGYRADAAIVVEPTDFVVQPVEGGLEWLRVVVRGRSGHSAYRYRSVHAGGQGTAVNAIEKAAKILAAVQELERHWGVHKRHPLLPAGITTINPGVIMGGTGGGVDGIPNVVTAVSTFPDYCALELSMKYLPSEETANVRAEFEDYISRVAATDPWLREHPPEIEWGIRGVSFPPAEIPMDHPLIQVLSEASEQAVGAPAVIEGMEAVTDLAWLAGAGIPGAIFGPGKLVGNAHGDNEHIAIADLTKGVFALALAVCGWCGVAAEG
ncbi:MAG: ArgE/DapE family deacylase [Thermomicrobiales bacterium]|nr:ArgE/DapE family deacylase [Thermomicrobiales bacterium]